MTPASNMRLVGASSSAEVDKATRDVIDAVEYGLDAAGEFPDGVRRVRVRWALDLAKVAAECSDSNATDDVITFFRFVLSNQISTHGRPYSVKTIDLYASVVRDLLDGVDNYLDLDSEHVRRFLAVPSRKRSLRITVLSHFAKVLHRFDLLRVLLDPESPPNTMPTAEATNGAADVSEVEEAEARLLYFLGEGR